MTTQNKILGVLLLIILALVVYIIVKSPGDKDESFDPAALREQIRIKDSTATHWEEEANSWHNLANTLGHKNDSLQHLKPEIQYHYAKKYTFNANANTAQLDSVIRSSW